VLQNIFGSYNHSWSEHIQSICNKNRKLVGLLYRQFYLNADADTLCQFYLSCVRPYLEYACTVRDPYLPKRKPLWRQCKSLPAKYAVRTGIWTMRACWVMHLTLQQRRWLQLKTSMIYQFVCCDSYIPEDVPLLHPSSNCDTRNCSYFSVLFARKHGYYYSFSLHITILKLASTYCSLGT